MHISSVCKQKHKKDEPELRRLVGGTEGKIGTSLNSYFWNHSNSISNAIHTQ